MRIVSDNIKNALKQPTTQRKGRILVNGNYYEVYNVEYYADAYEDGNVIGNAIASQLDFDLPYMDKFNTFKYFDGVWTGNEYEYVDMGTFTVFDEQDEDEFNKHITAFDNLIKFNKPFEETGTYPKTLYEELQNICQQADVELVNATIPNGNFQIENNQFVNGETLKTVLKAICQISGNYGIIKEDKLVLQLTNDTDETIIKNQHEPVIWKRKTYGINQVILQLEDVEGEYVIRQDEADIAENGVHKLVITNNPFAYTQDKRDALIDELFNQVRGFGYIPYEMNYEWLNYLEIGDKVIIDNIETIVLRIQGKSPKGLESMMSAPAIIDSAVEYADNTNSIKNQISRTEIIVDKQNQMIQSIASKVEDVSKTITGNGSITLENAYEGVLHKLTIKGNISLIYPNNNLFPSSNLYPQIFKLKVDESIYKLDLDYLNYINSEICDEFVYENGKCYVIRRIGIDENSNLYELENEILEEKNDLIINVLKESTITLSGFDNAILTAEYLLQNQYTDVFATEAYVNSEIKQTADEINIEVAKKVNEDEVVNTINVSTEEIKLSGNRLVVEADNFQLDKEGNMTCNDGNLRNVNIDGGKITMTGTYNNKRLIIKTNAENFITSIAPYQTVITRKDNLNDIETVMGAGATTFWDNNENCHSTVSAHGLNCASDNEGKIDISGITGNIQCVSLTQTSLEKNKKNFEKLDNALDIINNTDIYKYHLKNQNDNEKKHVGFVIGDDYNYSKEVTSTNNDGADIYSMASVCFEAIKEQQKEIENLKKEIKVLKEMIK